MKTCLSLPFTSPEYKAHQEGENFPARENHAFYVQWNHWSIAQATELTVCDLLPWKIFETGNNSVFFVSPGNLSTIGKFTSTWESVKHNFCDLKRGRLSHTNFFVIFFKELTTYAI